MVHIVVPSVYFSQHFWNRPTFTWGIPPKLKKKPLHKSLRKLVITHRLCGTKSIPTPDEFTGAKKCSMPTSEIWCRFGSDLAPVLRLLLLVPNRCQHWKFGIDLAPIWHQCQDCSYLCQIGTNIGNLVSIWLRFGTSVEIAVSLCQIGANIWK